MKYTKQDLEEKKRELRSLIDDYFSLSKHDEENKEKLIIKIRNLENEVQSIHNKLKAI